MSATFSPPISSWGAFSDEPPWVLDKATITWLPGTDGLRRAVRADLPALTRRQSKLPPGARVLKVVGKLGGGLGPWYAKKRIERYDGPEASRADMSLRLREAAIELGSTYIKLGQIISSGEGLFPRRAGERVQALPRPGAARTVGRGPRRDRVRARRTARPALRLVRP